jgi:acyl-CoA thioesterase FadM
MSYEIQLDGENVAIAETRHAMVNGDGRPVRIPKERRDSLQGLLAGPPKARAGEKPS